jgi:hypothetical protein
VATGHVGTQFTASAMGVCCSQTQGASFMWLQKEAGGPTELEPTSPSWSTHTHHHPNPSNPQKPHTWRPPPLQMNDLLIPPRTPVQAPQAAYLGRASQLCMDV